MLILLKYILFFEFIKDKINIEKNKYKK